MQLTILQYCHEDVRRFRIQGQVHRRAEDRSADRRGAGDYFAWPATGPSGSCSRERPTTGSSSRQHGHRRRDHSFQSGRRLRAGCAASFSPAIQSVKLLLDTHVVIWSQEVPANLGRKTRRLLVNLANELLISAASTLEIARLVANGQIVMK